MPAKKRTKWKGWIEAADVAPETMRRLRVYRHIFHRYMATLDSHNTFGTGHHMEAHDCAAADIRMTIEEREIYKRLAPETFDDIDRRYPWV